MDGGAITPITLQYQQQAPLMGGNKGGNNAPIAATISPQHSDNGADKPMISEARQVEELPPRKIEPGKKDDPWPGPGGDGSQTVRFLKDYRSQFPSEADPHKFVDRFFAAGDVADLPEDRAAELIARGIAELVPSPCSERVLVPVEEGIVASGEDLPSCEA